MLVKGSTHWDKEADVVIVGYGMAGAVAAITARDEVAQVLILEKQSDDSHCSNSGLSAGVFICSSDVKRTVTYIEGLNRVNRELYWTDKDITKVWAEYVADNKNWMMKLGGKVRFLATGGEHPDIPGAESIDLYMYRGLGLGMMKLLYDHIKRREIEVMYGTTSKRLLTNLQGEVVGVRAESGQDQERREINVKANRAVILACGGFEYDEQMKLNYLKIYPSYFYGSTANTGDGVRMAIEVGADLWHMNCCSARVVIKYPGLSLCSTVDFGGQGWSKRLITHSTTPEPAGYIVVDRHGRRFTSENFKLHSLYYELGLFDTQRLEYPRVPSYWVFDQRRMEHGPLPVSAAGPSSAYRLYKWSHDNSQELEKGWIITAKTIRDLARTIEMDPDTLQKTVSTYNKCCENGVDLEFTRRPWDLIPLNNPPFYAVKLWPGGANTQGGPKRNKRAQILNTYGEPISGLYGAGELGSIYGMLYPAGGGNLAECIAFGRIAGENAAKEKSKI